MSNNLTETVWPAGVGRIVLPKVDSTMAEAARRAADLPAPAWIMANAQSAARGRQGRLWRSIPDNFAATLLMRPEGPPAEAALRSFVAALALADALDAATGRSDLLALKWPNDVLLAGGKCAGILLERLGDGALLVGIGVNLAHAPESEAPDGLRPASVLGETGARIAPAAFLDRLAVAFAAREAQLARQSFAALRTDWLARAARLGQPIRARTGQAELHGTFETIDAAGHLVLMTAEGRKVIPAADVYF